MSAAAALVARSRTAAARPGSRVHEVAISRFAFVPKRLVIASGDTVVWRNADLAPHTATARGRGWDTGEIVRGASGSVRFEEPGRAVYVCAYHPRMTGEIIVTARESSNTPARR